MQQFYSCHRYGISDHGYVSFVAITIPSVPHSWLITGFAIRLVRLMKQEMSFSCENLHFCKTLVHAKKSVYEHCCSKIFVTRLTRRVPLGLTEYLSSPPVFSGVRVSRSLVLCVCFVDRCLSFCTFSFGRCGICSSSIYGFWLPLWYPQTLLQLEHTTQKPINWATRTP
jgi:hypothetical protein